MLEIIDRGISLEETWHHCSSCHSDFSWEPWSSCVNCGFNLTLDPEPNNSETPLWTQLDNSKWIIKDIVDNTILSTFQEWIHLIKRDFNITETTFKFVLKRWDNELVVSWTYTILKNDNTRYWDPEDISKQVLDNSIKFEWRFSDKIIGISKKILSDYWLNTNLQSEEKV